MSTTCRLPIRDHLSMPSLAGSATSTSHCFLTGRLYQCAQPLSRTLTLAPAPGAMEHLHRAKPEALRRKAFGSRRWVRNTCEMACLLVPGACERWINKGLGCVCLAYLCTIKVLGQPSPVRRCWSISTAGRQIISKSHCGLCPTTTTWRWYAAHIQAAAWRIPKVDSVPVIQVSRAIYEVCSRAAPWGELSFQDFRWRDGWTWIGFRPRRIWLPHLL